MKDSALIVVDMLYDFIDGSMACQEADKAVTNTLDYLKMLPARSDFPVLFVRDHHPANHCSFQAQGGPWPPHCVQGTHGADIHEALAPYAHEDLCFFKGEDPEKEQYSGFEGMNPAGQSLCDVLQILEIRHVVVCGICTEDCVYNTVKDLQGAGFKPSVLKDCIAYVEKEGHLKTLKSLENEGIVLI